MAEQDARALARAIVDANLYRATASEHFVLGPRDERVAISLWSVVKKRCRCSADATAAPTLSPVILRDPSQALDPRMRTVWAVEGAIATALLGVAVIGVVVVLVVAGAGTEAWIAGLAGGPAVIACAFLLVRLWPAFQHRHYRFEVTELGLYVASGWLWRRWQVVPHARVETVDITSGPLLRAFGLVAVRAATAAAKGGTDIPGLTPSAADALVEELARRAGIEERT